MSDVKVKFGAEDENLTSTLNKVQKELKQVETQSNETNDKFGMSFKGMAAAAAGVAIGIGAIKLAFDAVQGTIASFGEALDMGGRLSDLSGRTGETAGKLLLLERAFDNAGSSAEKVGPAINKLQKFMNDASDAGGTQAKLMDELGMSLDELKGKTPTEQMQAFASKITSIEDPTKRAAVAMEIFGKSGGELLPVLQNFSGELANAKTELGSMPAVMDKYSGVFDTVSDKLSIIGGKMTEFAAGVLSQIIPALELVTVTMAQFDAAGFGERLAKAFVGGQAAMEGFSAALDAVKVGEFALAFELTWASVKLQAKQTINEMYRDFIAGFTAISVFINDTIGMDSALFKTLSYSFDLLGTKMAQGLTDSLIPVVNSIPVLGEAAAKAMRVSFEELGIKAEAIKSVIGIYAGEIGSDFIDAGKAFPDSFKAAYESTKPLLAVEADLKKVEELSTAIGEKQAVANSKAVSKAGDLYAWFMGSVGATDAIANNMDRTAQNTDRVTSSQRGTNEELKKTKTIGDQINEAQERANTPAQKFGDIQKENKKSTEGLRDVFPQIGNAIESLSTNQLAKALGIETAKKSAQELAEDIQRYFKALKLKPMSEMLDFDATKDQVESWLKGLGESGLGVKLDLGKLADSLKQAEEQIKNTGLDLQLNTDSAVQGLRDKIEKGAPYQVDLVPKDKDGTGGSGSNATLEAIKSAVETIRTLVAKIEPKLPQTALAQ